jgi:hypothetical protein
LVELLVFENVADFVVFVALGQALHQRGIYTSASGSGIFKHQELAFE